MAFSVQAGAVVEDFSGAGTAVTVSLPASVVSGDLLLMIVNQSSNFGATATAGWTQIWNDGSSSDGFHVFTKTAGGSETNPSVTGSAGVTLAAGIVRIRGHAPAGAPAQLTAQTSTTTTASIDPPDAGSLKIGIAHIDPPSTAGAITWSGGATSLLAGTATNTTCYLAVAYKLEDTAGALTFSWGGSGTPGTLILSLAPDTGGGAPTFVPQVIVI